LTQTARLIDDANARPPDPFAGQGPGARSGAAIRALAATRIGLTNFRSYARTELKIEAVPVVLAGANGTGKTNLLEAISLLSPGRGLRSAKLAAIQRKAPADRDMVRKDGARKDALADSLWAVSATISRPDGEWEIGTGLLAANPNAPPRRALHLNGAAAASADLAELIPMLWLTPAMDRLFLEGASERRRFLDRLVFALDPAHAKRAARYERAMQERLRLLRDGTRDPVWLDGLEESMAADGAALTAARLAIVENLNAELAARGVEGAFPCAHLALRDGSNDRAGDWASDCARLQTALRDFRMRDADSARTNAGPHLADLEVRHTLKRSDARDCSTGEQKALLISIVLANAWLQKKRHGGLAPLLLLDEIAAHLDSNRRTALFEEILALDCQAWLTGTDRSLFAGLKERAAFLAIEAGQFVHREHA
jgi:DNA replication and repair protein RecF